MAGEGQGGVAEMIGEDGESELLRPTPLVAPFEVIGRASSKEDAIEARLGPLQAAAKPGGAKAPRQRARGARRRRG